MSAPTRAFGLATYRTPWGWRSGVCLEDTIVDTEQAARRAGVASEGDARWTSNRLVLGAGRAALELVVEAAERLQAEGAEGVRSRDDSELGPPIVDPRKLICLGVNYREHARETGHSDPAAPVLFAKFATALIGPRAAIEAPPSSEAVDFEGELAIVVGQSCRDIAAADALSCVAGGMVLNDVTARDFQLRTSQWMAGKALDTFAPCGPVLTIDPTLDLQDLPLRTEVNGQVVQEARTSEMIFSIAETISFLSGLMTLEPGDIVATGTPSGVGFKRDPQVLLRPGDMVEVEIGGLGRVSNRVVERSSENVLSTV
jgi:2-keto-4-pentenoate hydratase/2-oxohepta-3-ene-1,7-dioic acid hydratase in catechol pathway